MKAKDSAAGNWEIKPTSGSHFDVLDGMRGIAILLMVASHTLYTNPELRMVFVPRAYRYLVSRTRRPNARQYFGLRLPHNSATGSDIRIFRIGLSLVFFANFASLPWPACPDGCHCPQGDPRTLR
jgi:hypothetical protein